MSTISISFRKRKSPISEKGAAENTKIGTPSAGAAHVPEWAKKLVADSGVETAKGAFIIRDGLALTAAHQILGSLAAPEGIQEYFDQCEKEDGLPSSSVERTLRQQFQTANLQFMVQQIKARGRDRRGEGEHEASRVFKNNGFVP